MASQTTAVQKEIATTVRLSEYLEDDNNGVAVAIGEVRESDLLGG